MKNIFGLLAFIILVLSAYITFSNSWIAPAIAEWQSNLSGDRNYYPALTIFILSLPPLLLLVIIKWCLKKRSV